MKSFNIILILLFFISCLKTTEEINQENKSKESIAIETKPKVDESKILLSNLINKNKELEEQIMTLQGKIDDLSYKQSQSHQASSHEEGVNSDGASKMAQLEEKVLILESELNSQKQFIQKVTETLIEIKKSLSPQ